MEPNPYIKQYKEKFNTPAFELANGNWAVLADPPEDGWVERTEPPKGWKMSLTDGVAIPEEHELDE